MLKKPGLAKKIAHTLMAMSIVYSSGINVVVNEVYAQEIITSSNKTIKKSGDPGHSYYEAGGLALGSLVTETGAALKMAEAITLLPLTGGLETVFAFTLFSTVLTEISSNTAAAAIAVPVVQSIAQALGLNPIPYLFVAIVAFNSAYVLPVSIRAIPVSYGLDPAELFKNGLLLSLCSVLLITVVGYLFIRYWPLFSTV